jgi:hypothetical protein
MIAVFQPAGFPDADPDEQTKLNGLLEATV